MFRARGPRIQIKVLGTTNHTDLNICGSRARLFGYFDPPGRVGQFSGFGVLGFGFRILEEVDTTWRRLVLT